MRRVRLWRQKRVDAAQRPAHSLHRVHVLERAADPQPSVPAVKPRVRLCGGAIVCAGWVWVPLDERHQRGQRRHMVVDYGERLLCGATAASGRKFDFHAGARRRRYGATTPPLLHCCGVFDGSLLCGWRTDLASPHVPPPVPCMCMCVQMDVPRLLSCLEGTAGKQETSSARTMCLRLTLAVGSCRKFLRGNQQTRPMPVWRLGPGSVLHQQGNQSEDEGGQTVLGHRRPATRATRCW